MIQISLSRGKRISKKSFEFKTAHEHMSNSRYGGAFLDTIWFTNIIKGHFTNTGAVVREPQCQ